MLFVLFSSINSSCFVVRQPLVDTKEYSLEHFCQFLGQVQQVHAQVDPPKPHYLGDARLTPRNSTELDQTVLRPTLVSITQ